MRQYIIYLMIALITCTSCRVIRPDLEVETDERETLTDMSGMPSESPSGGVSMDDEEDVTTLPVDMDVPPPVTTNDQGVRLDMCEGYGLVVNCLALDACNPNAGPVELTICALCYETLGLELPNPPCPEVCGDDYDNDQDGLVDCEDSEDCRSIVTELGEVCLQVDEEFCFDGVDNDGDGFIDCDDADCVDVEC